MSRIVKSKHQAVEPPPPPPPKPTSKDGYFEYDGNMTVILLHGPGLSSEVWETTETFKHLVDKGIQAFAIDMPGHFKSVGQRIKENHAEFLKFVVGYVKTEMRVVVSASMTGAYSIPFLNKYGKEIDGYVAVAIMDYETLDPPEEVKNDMPVLAILGEKDQRHKGFLDIFRNTFKNLEEMIIPKGNHPCYKNDPSMFNEKLSSFVLAIMKKEEEEEKLSSQTY